MKVYLLMDVNNMTQHELIEVFFVQVDAENEATKRNSDSDSEWVVDERER